MRWIPVTLLGRRECGEDVFTLKLERPEGYVFSAGQYFVMRLEGESGYEQRIFSHASSPADDFLEITTHLSGSTFKQRLAAVRKAERIEVSPAAGRFGLPDSPPFVTFLAGGIGITPIRSIVRDAVQRRTGLRSVLLYGNRSPACVPYREELESYEAAGIETVHIFEQAPDEAGGKRGFITAQLVREYTDPENGLVVAAGPPAFVSAMDSVLDALEVEPERRIVERFGLIERRPM